MTRKATTHVRPPTGGAGGEAAAEGDAAGERVVERTLELHAPIERGTRTGPSPFG